MTAKAVPNGGFRNAAMHGPLVAASVIAELIAPLIERDGIASLAERSGVHERRIHAIVSRRQEWVSFNVADRLLTHGLGDPGLWHTTPELAAAVAMADGSVLVSEDAA